MRASATSKIASPANLHIGQANNNANKADPASPFALLVNDAAKPAQKPVHGDKSGNGKSESQDDGRQTADTGNAHQAPPVHRAASGKTDKSDKTDRQAKTEKSGQDGTPDVTAQSDTRADTKTDTATGGDNMNGNLSADLQQADAQALPPAQIPAPQPAITVTPANNGTGTVAVGAASAAGAPQAAQNTQNSQATASPDTDAEDQLADATAQAAQNTGQADTRPGAAKTDAKTGAVKGAAKATPVADAKANATAAKAENKADDVKADAAQAQAQSDKANADAPQSAKAAPPPVQTAGTPNIAGPQTPQVNAPSVTQHVQVAQQTAQNTAPNLPALAVQIASRSQSGGKQFDIRLDPPELGRVEVRLSIDSTGKASAHLSADQPQTLDLLQKDAPSLTRALRDAGLDVSQDGLNFSLRQQTGDGSNAGSNGTRGNGRGFSSLSATTSIEATAASAQYRAPADGRLDIRV